MSCMSHKEAIALPLLHQISRETFWNNAIHLLYMPISDRRHCGMVQVNIHSGLA